MNYFDQGVENYNNKNYVDAKKCFIEFIKQEPNNFVAHHNLGVTLIQLGLNDEAIPCFDLPCKNNYADSYISRGSAYRNLGKYVEALEDFAKTFIIDPYCAKAYSNYSNSLREFGKPDIALDFIKIANRINPDNTSQLNESITYLATENLVEGWKKYHYRWFYETGESLKPNLPGIEYDGSQDLSDKILLIYHEQGFGDCIQFARYINLCIQKNAKIVLLSKSKLTELMRFNYPGITVLDLNDNIPPYHYHVALLDLPKCFNTSIQSIPFSGAYLDVDEKLKSDWRNILGPKTKHRVGLAWTSNGIAYNTKFRRMDLNELVHIVNDKFEFINLHYTPNIEEKNLLDKYSIKNFNEHLGNFYYTAGLISNLDCVVTVDTVTAHLSGALGVPTYVMLPNYGCDWRWFTSRTDSPFYNSMRLFRKSGDNWDSVIQELKLHLNYLFY